MMQGYKKILVIIIIVSGAAMFFWTMMAKNKPASPSTSQEANQISSDKPQIISTKPDPLDNTIVPATEPIEITFNKALQNAPEFKIRIEPKVEFKVELSSDRKTAKIIFTKPLDLGSVYTLSIAADTKFEQVGEWRQSKEFHFRTINYRGI